MVDPDSSRALRPLRKLTLPRGRTLLRAGLVAALLCLAAAVLHTPAGCPPTVAPADAPSVADDTARQVESVADDTARPLDEGRSSDSSGTGSPGTPRTAAGPPS
ncbi:hypothetical protein [Micromonospora inaquosa]|uniref:hypothetical protein n=1 Tax=Micromonospora inaquosa TaxID=2203716 RepID=UPI001ABFFAA6|nr:hypothetical protein [Micromonospora inaquosa]